MSDTPLLPFAAAQARILQDVRPLANEWTPLEEALGRCLGEAVAARRTQPPWDNSAMDGYALRSEDGRSGARLKVVEAIFAGHAPTRRIGPGECARIMTGAPVPEGADAVVMQEKTRAHPGEALGEMELLVEVAPGANVRQAGEDAREGEPLLAAGSPLGIPEAGLLWGQGILGVPVPRRPSVAIVATGDELCRPDALAPGRIADTNSPSLALAAQRAGARAHLIGIARDTLEDTVRLLSAALEHDVVLTSAGVSVGERDFVRPALAQLGVEPDFFGVAIKPGKPVAFGRRGKTRVFGLPGNPTSSLVTFELFVRPLLRALLGHASPLPERVVGKVDGKLGKQPGLAHFVRVTTELRDGALWARPLATQTSGALRSAAAATHLLHFPQEASRLEPGDGVELLPVHWA